MMPSKSQAQHNLMAMVANDPAASKRLGIPKSVGEEFTAADKGKKFSTGTRADSQVANQPKTNHGEKALFKRGGLMETKMGKPVMKPGMSTAKDGMKKPTPMAKASMKKGGNTSRMNRLEELGRVDSEKAYTSKGKKNLAAEKSRIIGGLKKMATGGMTSMGSVKTAAPSRDGIASKGKTKGMMPKMAGNSIGTGPAMKKGGMSKKYC